MSCEPVQIMQNPDSVNVKQATSDTLVIQQSTDVRQSPNSVMVIQTTEVINVCAQNPVAQFRPFFLVAAADGQTVFALPYVALSIWVAINGIEQSQAKTPTPDFAVTGNVLTLSGGVDQGDTVFGMIQIA